MSSDKVRFIPPQRSTPDECFHCRTLFDLGFLRHRFRHWFSASVGLLKFGMTLAEKALEVYRRLLELHGERAHVPRREPMHELISTMLSHRTTAQNEQLAYDRMRERFGSWGNIRDAPVEALAQAIAPSNYPDAKAPNIQKTLRRISDERNGFDLNFLADLSEEEAMSWLTSLPGVGVKTATLVLLFCFAKRVIPVDTHLHRVCGRVGLIGEKTSAEAAHRELLELLPPDPPLLYNFHIAMLRHGQKICVWKNPRCEKCPLTALCDWFQKNRAEDA